MTLTELVARFHDRPCKKIIVTGPQRSGTTIATVMLAKALGVVVTLEEAINFRDVRLLCRALETNLNQVIQAPSLSAICHRFGVPVVFMRRNVIDIQRSQKRINWNEEEHEKRQYFYTGDLPIAVVKYQNWEKYQKPRMPEGHAFDLDYESLCDDPMWVPAELRRTFKPRQFS